MRYRDPKKESDLFSMIEHQQSVLKAVKGINKLNAVIDWELFREDLESILGYDHRDPKWGGRPPFDAVLMLKVLVLQKYYGLSDEETEFQIMDRFSFLQFLGLQAGDDVPDARTIWDFKQLLEKDGRDGSRRLFERFGQQLQAEGLLAREGSIVDAKSKLIDGYTTPASVHDSKVLEDLVDESDEAVFADSAYQSEASEAYLLSKDRQNFILFKGRRGHPLSEEEQATKKLRSRIRVRCEHVFGRMSQMAMDRLRTIGLLRAGQHNGLCNLVYNMDRYAFLCPNGRKKRLIGPKTTKLK